MQALLFGGGGGGGRQRPATAAAQGGIALDRLDRHDEASCGGPGGVVGSSPNSCRAARLSSIVPSVQVISDVTAAVDPAIDDRGMLAPSRPCTHPHTWGK